MSAVIQSDLDPQHVRRWPMLAAGDPLRTVAWRGGHPISARAFLADVALIAGVLPGARHAVNLCEDRYAFIAAFCAVASRAQTTLLPPSRARKAVDEVLHAHADTYVISDVPLDPAPHPLVVLPELAATHACATADVPLIDGTHTVAIGFTSGSTGRPKPNAKTWDNFRIGSALNIDVLARAIGLQPGQVAQLVATVPAQHMYGMEMSVLLPLFGPFAVCSERPFFPGDVAATLAALPAPRVLVTTPVHLRSLMRGDVALPPVAAIISATAPLPAPLAAEAEARFGAPVIELFGSTETCVIAHRRSARECSWTLLPGVELRPQPDGTLVTAAHLPAQVLLHDVVDILPEGRFDLCGRNADLLEIAGKRASLADLTRRLLEVPGVVDAAVFQHAESGSGGVQRLAALVVAPGLCERDLLDALRQMIDPVFLPRPIRCVERLPRNETGKLPRDAALAALGTARRADD